jgi:kinesin family protein 2/24
MQKSRSDSRLGTATPREAVAKKARPSEGRIRVVVRKRPLSARELDEGRRDVLQLTTAAGVPVVMVHEPKTKVDMTAYVETHAFRFDGAYGEGSSNRAVYDGTAAPLIDYLFAGQTATCFAYGATGAGKTHT